MQSEPPAREAAIVARLLDVRSAFLAFLERRLGDPAAAEEVLQAAYLTAFERAGEIEQGERAVAWFYRLLRNALVDRARRVAAERRAVERLAAEPLEVDDGPLRAAVCTCVGSVLGTLKPEYADVLRRAELGDQAVSDVAHEIGITPNNAAVRLHRARAALRGALIDTCGACAEHGCLDCTCRHDGRHPRRG